ncbi:hypothetical protein O181_007054 [Austropuccinia psidii MF-1]|uniref:Uncharacterized protein n=1 Tax=Austropuccinia psidii MF-1 TaxID=1389203 RepID=A0A9Q3BK87_9BASI|nr:hypothetical protein [Austropuccinia psidii MF-1]
MCLKLAQKGMEYHTAYEIHTAKLLCTTCFLIHPSTGHKHALFTLLVDLLPPVLQQTIPLRRWPTYLPRCSPAYMHKPEAHQRGLSTAS